MGKEGKNKVKGSRVILKERGIGTDTENSK
jgi:hypothetical protein